MSGAYPRDRGVGGGIVTRQRIYGEDTVWGAWMRSLGQPGGPLPSSSKTRGTTVNDWDVIVHQYKTPVDNQGTRDVHCMMFLECKTRLADVSPTQTETLWFNHQAICKKFQASLPGSKQKVSVWHYGVSILSCHGDDPAHAQFFRWGRFDRNGRIVYHDVSLETVILLLTFDYDPDTIRHNSFRRHHKVSVYTAHVQTPMGVLIEQTIKRRS